MKKYRIDKNKNIGNVIFVVEGGNTNTGGTELRLLKKIFADILGYEVQELRRGSEEFIGYGCNPQFRDLVFTKETIEAENRLLHSINEMNNGLTTMGIDKYDLDNLAPTLLDVYDYQQQRYISENTFSLFSFVGMALLELGVIVEYDDDN